MSDLQWVCSVQSNSFVGAELSGRRRRRGRGPLGTPKFLSPAPPLSPWLLPCLGGGSSMERRFCLRIAPQRVFRTNFLPHPPAPFPEGRGNFIVLFCREASPPAPRVPGGCTLYKGKLARGSRFFIPILRLSARHLLLRRGVEAFSANFAAFCKTFGSDTGCRGRSLPANKI